MKYGILYAVIRMPYSICCIPYAVFCMLYSGILNSVLNARIAYGIFKPSVNPLYVFKSHIISLRVKNNPQLLTRME